jgi:hypothetical protein
LISIRILGRESSSKINNGSFLTHRHSALLVILIKNRPIEKVAAVYCINFGIYGITLSR